MDLAKHELLFSNERLKRYLAVCGHDPAKTIKLYKYNIQVCQALYPLISILEVALRNAIDRQLSGYFKDPRWLLNKRNDFANHPDMKRKGSNGNVVSDYFFRDKLQKAEKKLTYRGVPVSHGKLLAELTFGFWVKFFDSTPVKILKGVPLQAFTNKPPIKLALVHSHLNSIVTLRNRIAHNEPVCFDKAGNLCLSMLENYERDICAALGWIDSDLKVWAEKMNFFKPVYSRIAAI